MALRGKETIWDMHSELCGDFKPNARRFKMRSTTKARIQGIMLLFLLLPVVAPAAEGLLYKINMTYLGAFRLPQGDFGGSNFAYGGHALAPYHDPVSGKNTLFMEGHDWYPGFVAQVEIPPSFVNSSNWDDLPQASVLQNFFDITDGKSDSLTNDTFFVYGMLPYNGRLAVGASEYYDANYSQVNSHGVSGFNLSTTNDFQGFYAVAAAANARSLGGYMTTIPYQWQSLLGGPALTGNCCLPIISANSAGPAATVFNPDHVGTVTPIPGTTVLFYPLAHPLAPETTQNNLFNLATHMGGIAFPAGSRSVVFVGRQGTGPYCYGCGINQGDSCPVDCEGECCVDPCDLTHGTHAYPYVHQVWAYDADDLVAVRNGQTQHWEPQPYATWTLDDMDTSGCADIKSAGYDPSRRLLYITQVFGDFPRVDVYRIGYPTDILAPARIPVIPPLYFNNLTDAYNALTGDGTIQAREFFFEGDLTLDRYVAVILDGGYDSSYSTYIGNTVMKGRLTIIRGSLTAARLEIW
jgi:hypothetical protein